MLPDPPRWYIFHSELSAGLKGAARGAFQIMQTHHMLRWIVQHHTEIGKIQEAVQPLGKVVEQFGRVSPRSDNPRHFVQREALLDGKLRGRLHVQSPSAQES